MGEKSWIGVDFDGTLAKYDGWSHELGEPIPLMLERVRIWLDEGRRVKIMTARVSKTTRDTTKDVEQQRIAIENWCSKYLGRRLEVTCEKDYGMIQLWDDRAVTVQTNTGVLMSIGI